MQITKVVTTKEALELTRRNGGLPYRHERLPDAFVEKAGRVYDRLEGSDPEVERVTRQQWVDDCRKDTDFEAEIEVLVQCLAAVSKWERRYGAQARELRRGIYFLARTRSYCKDPEQAFRETAPYFGFQFCDPDKNRLMRVIDSCVRYLPIVAVGTQVHTKPTAGQEGQYGTGKSCLPRRPNDSDSNGGAMDKAKGQPLISEGGSREPCPHSDSKANRTTKGLWDNRLTALALLVR